MICLEIGTCDCGHSVVAARNPSKVSARVQIPLPAQFNENPPNGGFSLIR